MENKTSSNVAVLLILILLACYIAILSDNKEKFMQMKKEQFENNNKEEEYNELEGECKNMKKNNILYTPTSVNLPFIDHYPKPEPQIFNTLKNYEDKPNNKITGKYCFPIEKLMYDGIWESHVTDINEKCPEKQKRNWDMPNYKPCHGLYCGDDVLKLPEKTLNVGDEIITSDNCDKYYPKPHEVKEKIRACTEKSTQCIPTEFEKNGLIETTDGKWQINGL